MKTGRVVTMPSCRVSFANEIAKGSLGYKAPKGEQFVFLLLGSEPTNGPKLSPVDALHALGWAACSDCTHGMAGQGYAAPTLSPPVRAEAGWLPKHIYRAEDGTLRVRPREEFEDGRFVPTRKEDGV